MLLALTAAVHRNGGRPALPTDRSLRSRSRSKQRQNRAYARLEIFDPADALFWVHVDSSTGEPDELPRNPSDDRQRIDQQPCPCVPGRCVVVVEKTVRLELGGAVEERIVGMKDQQSSFAERIGETSPLRSVRIERDEGRAFFGDEAERFFPVGVWWLEGGRTQATSGIGQIGAFATPDDRLLKQSLIIHRWRSSRAICASIPATDSAVRARLRRLPSSV